MNVFPNPAAEAFSIQVPLQEEMLSFTTIDITEKRFYLENNRPQKVLYQFLLKTRTADCVMYISIWAMNP
jgi:hypothetical protein